jgi:hypothetical protein
VETQAAGGLALGTVEAPNSEEAAGSQTRSIKSGWSRSEFPDRSPASGRLNDEAAH